ncbi:MAG TPA: HxsD-like protein [Polyangiaceae bacterium]|nr:HxsD-like protein [Polyangiaceae bacterium]
MIELRFHHELYDGFAVDEAAKVYGEFATFDLEEGTQGYIVRVTALPAALEQGIDERTIGAELMNYALGKTIEKSLAGAGAGGGAS